MKPMNDDERNGPRYGIPRRTVLVGGVAGAAVLAFPIGCAIEDGRSGSVDGTAETAGAAGADGFFTPEQYETARALFDILIPEDRTPGATRAAVVDYASYLLGAFNFDPPLIYASGPFSGRHGGVPRFGAFLPLSRVQEIAWRNTIEGSQGIPEREFNGPVTGWQEIYTAGLAQLDAVSLEQFGRRFAVLSAEERLTVTRGVDRVFMTAASEHAVEGMYAAPEYGGNKHLTGWKNIEYEGDRQPLGYNLEQVSEPDAGELGDDDLRRAADLLRDALERRGKSAR
ncbi:MAG: gluconate 2-dehydrogenase subunit 3 family protein [Deltaproteobacteria bacterium]|nr:gluconate 2-dehydrogenase subunit 3 family protein [Deltaproteobacteria bacterium]